MQEVAVRLLEPVFRGQVVASPSPVENARLPAIDAEPRVPLDACPGRMPGRP